VIIVKETNKTQATQNHISR